MKLFEASNADWGEVMNCVKIRITDDRNKILVRPITDVEVRDALFQMHPAKSLGPDRMTPAFYQKYWSIVGWDVVSMVAKFFQDGLLLQNLIETNMVLIPKKNSPSEMGDLRPISLCNVLVKVITKVMANRMKFFLKKIVSEYESTFDLVG